VTLMEAVVALVILALVAIGCLELAQGASQLEYSATQWNAAVSVAESRMAQLISGAPALSADMSVRTSSSDSTMRVGTRVMRENFRAGLDVISVTVPVEGGKSFVLRRVVPSVARPTIGLAR
jgi:hypothetical protein